MVRFILLGLLAVATSVTMALAQSYGDFEQGREVTGGGDILEFRDRIAPENDMTRDRLENLLPALMDETGIDMWLVINREYAEDPVYFTLVPQPAFAARRTTILVFHKTDDAFEMLTVNRYPLGEPYVAAWEGGDLDAQWEALAALIEEKDPERIGINVSSHWPVADGLTHGLHQKLESVLPSRLERRLVSAEDLVIRCVSIGEESGALDEMLEKVADHYETEVDAAIDNLTSLLEPMIMSFLGIVVGGLMVAMYLPIFTLGNVIGA